MKVYDFNEKQYFDFTITSEKEMRENVSFVEGFINNKGFTMPLSIIVYDDGTIFTIDDWQGFQPKTPEEIENYNWIESETGKPAIMIDGLPRTIG